MNLVDRMVAYVNPRKGAERAYFRMMENEIGRELERMSYRQMRRSNTSPELPNNNALDSAEISETDFVRVWAYMRREYRSGGAFPGIVDGLVDHIVGPEGPSLQIKTGDSAYNAEIEAWWSEAKDSLDVRGMFSFADICRMGERDNLLVGDVALIKHPEDGKLQGVEAEQIQSPATSQSFLAENRIFSGIRYSEGGAALTYYIGGYDKSTGMTKPPKSYPAAQIIYHPNMDRFSSERGLSACFSSMENITDLGDYLQAEKSRAKFAALFGLKFTTSTPAAGQTPLGNFVTGESVGKKTTLPSVKVGKLTNFDLLPNEDVEMIESKAPSSQLTPFSELMLRFIGLGIGPIPLEFVLLDFSRGNFSGIRAAFLAAVNTYLRRQNRHAFHLAGPVFDFAYRHAVKNKTISEPKDKALKKEWIYPAYQYINPREEIAAIGDALDRGLTTLQIEAAKQGSDWQELAGQRAKEVQFFRDNNIPLVVQNPGSNVSGKETPDKK